MEMENLQIIPNCLYCICFRICKVEVKGPISFGWFISSLLRFQDMSEQNHNRSKTSPCFAKLRRFGVRWCMIAIGQLRAERLFALENTTFWCHHEEQTARASVSESLKYDAILNQFNANLGCAGKMLEGTHYKICHWYHIQVALVCILHFPVWGMDTNLLVEIRTTVMILHNLTVVEPCPCMPLPGISEIVSPNSSEIGLGLASFLASLISIIMRRHALPDFIHAPTIASKTIPSSKPFKYSKANHPSVFSY